MRWAILLLGLGLVGCGRHSDISMCEDAIKEKLVAPSTYSRVEVKEGYQSVSPKYTIVYDSENSFGASLRGEALCYLDTERTTVKAFP